MARTLLERKYFKSNRKICPFCDSKNIVGSRMNMGLYTSFRRVECKNCNEAWEETFRIRESEGKESYICVSVRFNFSNPPVNIFRRR
ncbi:MAG: hypothetical protein AABY32_01850 [Nanoarchaeota archaeon]